MQVLQNTHMNPDTHMKDRRHEEEETEKKNIDQDFISHKRLFLRMGSISQPAMFGKGILGKGCWITVLSIRSLSAEMSLCKSRCVPRMCEERQGEPLSAAFVGPPQSGSSAALCFVWEHFPQ